MAVITCPRYLDDTTVMSFLTELKGQKDAAELSVDLSTVTFVLPFGTLVAASALRKLRDYRLKKGLPFELTGCTATPGAVSYLRYFGFFRFIEGREEDYHVVGNDKYLPVHIIKREGSDLCEERRGEVIQARIKRESEHLAAVLTPGEAEYGPAQALAYSFREMIRNSFEHGKVDECLVMGQRWANGSAEVAILDDGEGIFNSLSKKYEIATESDALRLALQPGITSGTVATGSDWDNSGFGLYVVSELAKQYGELTIVSSHHMLTNVSGIEHIKSVPWSGTIVKLKLTSLSNEHYFTNILETIIKEGERLATEIPGSRRTASKGSRFSGT